MYVVYYNTFKYSQFVCTLCAITLLYRPTQSQSVFAANVMTV